MRTPNISYPTYVMGYTEAWCTFLQCRARSSPNLHHHRPVTAQVTQPSRTEPLMKRTRMTRTLNICKRSKRKPDTPHVPHPRICAGGGKNAEFGASDTEEHALPNKYPTVVDDELNREVIVPYPLRRNRTRPVEHPDRARSHDTRGVRFHLLEWRGVRARPEGRTRQTSIALHWLS
jgi:hypothetical protein